MKKLHQIIMQKDNCGYEIFDTQEVYLWIIAHIITDGALTPKELKEMLLNPELDWAGGNYIECIIEGDTVLVGSLFDDDDDEKVKISRENLIKYIDDWYEAIKDQPDEGIIYRDDEYNIWMEPKVHTSDKE